MCFKHNMFFGQIHLSVVYKPSKHRNIVPWAFPLYALSATYMPVHTLSQTLWHERSLCMLFLPCICLYTLYLKHCGMSVPSVCSFCHVYACTHFISNTVAWAFPLYAVSAMYMPVHTLSQTLWHERSLCMLFLPRIYACTHFISNTVAWAFPLYAVSAMYMPVHTFSLSITLSQYSLYLCRRDINVVLSNISSVKVHIFTVQSFLHTLTRA